MSATTIDRVLADGRRLRRVGRRWCVVEPFNPATLPPGKSRPPCDLYGGVGQLIDDPDGRLVVVADLAIEDVAAAHHRITMEEQRRFVPLAVGPRDPVADEVARLVDMGLHASAKAVRDASPAPEPDPALIALGVVQWDSRGCNAAGVSADLAESLVLRHTVGDWGVIGRREDVELGGDELSVPEAFGDAVRNAVAEKTRRGVVRSIYAVATPNDSSGAIVLDGARATTWGWDKAPGASTSHEIRVESYPGLGSTLVYTRAVR